MKYEKLTQDVLNNEARRMDKAKFQMMTDHNFYAFMILSTEMNESFDIPTMATDGDKMWYNPIFTQTLTDGAMKGVLKHEGKHIMHKHHLRGPIHHSPEEIAKMDEQTKADVMRKHVKWNLATDYAINLELKDEGEELPTYTDPKTGKVKIDAKLDEKWRGMTAEQIYRKLPEEEVDKAMAQMQGGNIVVVGEIFKKGGKEMSKAEQQKEEVQIDAKIINAAAQAKKAGNLPKGMDRFVEGLTRQDFDPLELLRDYVEKSICRNDFDWRLPNKRYACQQGVYLPALWGEEVKDIFIICDTSGSIGQKEMDILAGNLTNIVSTFNATVTVAYCDTKVSSYQVFTPYDVSNDKLKLKPTGGGGTRFAPAFEWIKEKEFKPKVVLYMTDLECSDFGKEPEYPVIWIYLRGGWYGGDRDLSTRVPFGKIVEIDTRKL